MMQKQEIYALLDSQSIWYEVTEHKAVYNMAEVSELDLPYPEANAKNLFVRDGKQGGYHLITARGDRRVDLKAFRQQSQIRSLKFASPEELLEILGLIPGAVTPLGLLNDWERVVTLWMDQVFLEPPGLIGVHPNDNTATVWLKTEDLLHILRQHGNRVMLFEG